MSEDRDLKERLDFAVRIAREAAALMLRYYQSSELAVERKADETPVTRADREAEELLWRRLESACSDDSVVGEEFGAKSGPSEYTWYLDPVDGTQSFARGVPLFGTMVGVARVREAVRESVVRGVEHNPCRFERRRTQNHNRALDLPAVARLPIEVEHPVAEASIIGRNMPHHGVGNEREPAGLLGGGQGAHGTAEVRAR